MTWFGSEVVKKNRMTHLLPYIIIPEKRENIKIEREKKRHKERLREFFPFSQWIVSQSP